MREPTPSINFDPKVGYLVNDIDVNYDALIAYMQGQGFDDAAIESTVIYVLSNDTLEEGEDGKLYATDGLYNRKTGDIALYPYRAAYVFDKAADDLDSDDQVEALRQHMSAAWSERFSRILVHELTHKRRHPANPSETGEGAEQNLLSRSLGTAALSRDEYISSEEEAACEEAARRGPKDLFFFDFKR